MRCIFWLKLTNLNKNCNLVCKWDCVQRLKNENEIHYKIQKECCKITRLHNKAKRNFYVL